MSSHDIMFDEDDPVLARLQSLCLAFPGADRKITHGRPVFFTKKIFSIFGAYVKGAEPGRYDQAILFLPDEDEHLGLVSDERFFVPGYWGPWGWLAFDVAGAPADELDWDEIAELIDMSYRRTAPKRLVAELDRS